MAYQSENTRGRQRMQNETVKVCAADIVKNRIIKPCAEQRMRNYRINRIVVNFAPAVIGNMNEYVIAPFLRVAYNENYHRDKCRENHLR